MSESNANPTGTPPAGNPGDNGNPTGNGGTGKPPVKNGEGGTPPPSGSETVPHAQFHAMNEKRKEAEAELAKFRDEQKAAEEKKQLEAGEHQKIIDGLKPQAERSKVLEGTLEKILESELKNVPEDKKSLIPTGLPVEQQLEYIVKNRAILTGSATPPNINHGGNPGQNPTGNGKTFTISQIQDSKFYQENEAEIKKAYSEGRIVEG